MEALRRAQSATFEDAIATELRIGVRLVERNDIREGVRAVLVDRDNSPAWSPAKLEDVTQEYVDSFFLPLEDASKELSF
jgi:enoyl-CoA hydratase